jgi:hypothetical protein
MWTKLLVSPLLFAYIAVGVSLSIIIGIMMPGKLALPVLQVAIGYPVMASLLARGLRRRAVFAMLWWALCLGVVMVTTVVNAPERCTSAIFHGPEYVDEMFRWIRTGIGAEGTPSLFIPQHLLHLGIFVVLSLCTASLVSLLMGAVLMNYMSFYVGSLIVASRDFWLSVMMGWHPWSILRVAAFVILGVILAEPLICRIARRPYSKTGAHVYLWIAIALLLGDIAMKAALAPWWGATLRRLVL